MGGRWRLWVISDLSHLQAMDGQELDGRQVRVDFSITKRPHTPTPGKYMGRPSRDFNRSGPPGGHRGGRERYGDRWDRGDRYGEREGGSRYREERRYDDRDRSVLAGGHMMTW